jgi:hypothetical protein
MSKQPVRRPFLRFLLFIAAGLFLLFFFLAISWGVFSSGPTNWTKNIEATYIAGPVREDGGIDYLAALNIEAADGVDLEENAALWYLDVWDHSRETAIVIEGYEIQLGWDRDRFPTKYFRPVSDDSVGKEVLDLRQSLHDGMVVGTDYTNLRNWLSDRDQIIQHLLAGTRQSNCYIPIVPVAPDGSLIDASLRAIQAMREYADVICIRGHLHILDADLAAARQDSLAIRRMAKHAADHPILLALLVAYAVNGLATELDQRIFADPTLTAADARQHLDDIAKLPDFPTISSRLTHGERMAVLDAATQIAFGRKCAYLDVDGGEVLTIVRKAVDWERVMVGLNEQFDQLAADLEIDDLGKRDLVLAYARQARALRGKLTKRLPKAIFLRRSRSDLMRDVLAEMFLPLAVGVVEAEKNFLSRQQLTQLCGVLAIYRAENGVYPIKLAELVPKYLSEFPLDPASGQSFVYRQTEQSYELYGVGRNGKDDGGDSIETGDDVVAETPGWRIKMVKPEPMMAMGTGTDAPND